MVFTGNNVPKSVSAAAPSAQPTGVLATLDAQIVAQGNKIRDLKGIKATKDVIDGEVKALLSLKADFKKEAGKDWDPKGTLKNNIGIYLRKRTHGVILFLFRK